MVEPDPTKGLTDPHLSIWPLRMSDLSASINDDSGYVIGRVERYDGRGRLRPPQIETEFITRNVSKSILEKIGLYFSSLREFDGYQINVVAEENIEMPTVMEHIWKTSGAWFPDTKDLEKETAPSLPKNYKDMQWFFRPSLKLYSDHLPITSANMFGFISSDRYSPMKELLYVLDYDSQEPLYGLWLETRGGNNNQYSFPQNWWERDGKDGIHKHLKPFNLIAFGITQQVSGVTILNNVIDPTKQESTALSYTLTRRGRVTINVFTLDGTLVRRLYSGVRDPGDYDVSWDGHNQGGRPVARGMYFIRVVAPDIDEIRKVMVVK
jgi:hypothetical protein